MKKLNKIIVLLALSSLSMNIFCLDLEEILHDRIVFRFTPLEDGETIDTFDRGSGDSYRDYIGKRNYSNEDITEIYSYRSGNGARIYVNPEKKRNMFFLAKNYPNFDLYYIDGDLGFIADIPEFNPESWSVCLSYDKSRMLYISNPGYNPFLLTLADFPTNENQIFIDVNKFIPESSESREILSFLCVEEMTFEGNSFIVKYLEEGETHFFTLKISPETGKVDFVDVNKESALYEK